MKHVIAGRLGTSDGTEVGLLSGERISTFDFMTSPGQFGHGIQHALTDLAALGIPPTEDGLDLFLFATMVYAADTRINRRSESQDGWTRQIRLVMPVHDLARWEASKDILEMLLKFLTGDLWTLGFRPRPAEYRALPVLAAGERRVVPFTDVALFSGGMDSLIGAIDELQSGRVPLLVSHAGDGPTSTAQESCFNGLKEHFPEAPFERFRVWLQVKNGLVDGVKGENTTRSRSFLFIAAAMMAGSGLRKTFSLRVPENGLIALNVPLDPNRVGALSTRTTHPFYFARWQEVAGLLGIEASILNPYWNATKGEMVERCANPALLRDLLGSSMSCSSPAKARWQGRGIEHCGYCLPCIIRRAAVLRGFHGLFPDPTTYTLADMEGELSTRKSIGKQVRSFQIAIARLEARPELAKYLILKTGPLSDVPGQRDDLAGVYLRGMAEVGKLLGNVVTSPK